MREPNPRLSPFVLIDEKTATLFGVTELVVDEGNVDGEPGLVPPPGSVMRMMRYEASEGSFNLVSIEGFSAEPAALRSAFGEVQVAEVAGGTCVVFASSDLTWAVHWSPAPHLTIGLDSSELSPEQLVALIDHIRWVDEPSWRSQVPGRHADHAPRRSRTFESLGPPTSLATGSNWEAWTAPAVAAPSRPTHKTYLHTWVTRHGSPWIDYGWASSADGTWPAMKVPEGALVVALFDRSVATVRVELPTDEVIIKPVCHPHPDAPAVAVAMAVPLISGRTTLTAHRADGSVAASHPVMVAPEDEHH